MYVYREKIEFLPRSTKKYVRVHDTELARYLGFFLDLEY